MHDFYLGDGWYGSVEWIETDGLYTGLMYVMSECSINHIWSEHFNKEFSSEADMIEWTTARIEEENL